MRTRLSSRLVKAEQAVIVAPDRRMQDRRLENQQDAQNTLAQHPDLALVTEADASPLAWRALQIDFATARGDFVAADRLTAEHFQVPQAPPEEHDRTRWEINRIARVCVEQVNQVAEAVARARKRLGVPPQPTGGGRGARG